MLYKQHASHRHPTMKWRKKDYPKILNDIYLDVKNQRGQNVVTTRTNAPV